MSKPISNNPHGSNKKANVTIDQGAMPSALHYQNQDHASPRPSKGPFDPIMTPIKEISAGKLGQQRKPPLAGAQSAGGRAAVANLMGKHNPGNNGKLFSSRALASADKGTALLRTNRT